MKTPQRPNAPTIRIELLGNFRVAVGDCNIPDSAWRQRKATALLKLLALAPGLVLPREQVLDLLWPDMPPAAAAHNLRYALHIARRILEGPPAYLPRALHRTGASTGFGRVSIVSSVAIVPEGGMMGSGGTLSSYFRF